ncbi:MULTISPECIES: PaaI family thioesterase [Thermomonosporaceae]|uniref:PaaI family thioesterase n=1 Tax=Thermomonosporaceae TaxID=2012 RepID=UPI00255B2FC4|nr:MULTISPECIES: PaaI family thioesterase [Thermomonosporaceae]MDL4771565.1 PaaI family thioesterase [Actinomadura xylanilytica]
MSGAEAAMQRAMVAREPHAMDEDQVAVLAGLAARVRELIEAVVLTGAPKEEVADVSAEVALLTARLSAVRRDAPPIAELGANGLVRQLAGPVGGPLNPVAPPVDIQILPDGTARAEFTLSAVYEGPPSFVHGGVSALVLDQVLGVAAAANGTPGMTATLELRYRRPTPYGARLTVEAKAVRAEGRKTFVDGRVIGPDGRTTVEATAMFVIPAG